ncbi:MAG TPA: LemA family protein [Candidatus Gastranaerophilales bacterium]|nr:LemA family protein [Candidatus Gastranaerophilales bacterium]
MKKTALFVVGGILLLLVILFGSFIGTYNSLQIQDETVTSSWAQVENQLQRRNDLIPNLVNTVKGYASHEKEIFTNIAESRSKLAGAVKSGNVGDVNKANAEFSGALSRLLAIAENYPNLKANQNFIALQDELAGTENRIAVSRKDYNETVKVLNAKIRTFPTVIIANISGIKAREYFEVEESAKQAPDVKF